MKKILMLAAVALLAGVLAGCSQNDPVSPASSSVDNAAVTADSGDKNFGGGEATYEVTIENLTPATSAEGSQPFSPPVLATHRPGYALFRPGQKAGPAMADLAREGMTDPLVGVLEGSGRVHDIAVGDAPIGPGQSATFMITADRRTRFLSGAFMLVNTNDGFAGPLRMILPRRGQRSIRVRAWDAGAELNTELASDIPGPCCGSHLTGPDESGRIRLHRGIRGNGDLDPAIYDWHGPVAKITVRRVD